MESWNEKLKACGGKEGGGGREEEGEERREGGEEGRGERKEGGGEEGGRGGGGEGEGEGREGGGGGQIEMNQIGSKIGAHYPGVPHQQVYCTLSWNILGSGSMFIPLATM